MPPKKPQLFLFDKDKDKEKEEESYPLTIKLDETNQNNAIITQPKKKTKLFIPTENSESKPTSSSNHTLDKIVPSLITFDQTSHEITNEPEPKEQLCDIVKKQCVNNQDVIAKSGSQGTAYINCPNNNSVIKLYTFNKIHKLHGNNAKEDDNIYLKMCDHMNYFINNKFPNLLKSGKCSRCDKNKDNKIIDGQIVSLQEKAKGDDLKNFIMNQNIKTINENIFLIIFQVIATIDYLYRSKLYHNDVHVENVMIESMSNTNPINYTYNINNFTINLNKHTFKFLVKLIDYGLITNNYPRDAEYYETKSLSLPFIDIAQFFNTMDIFLSKRIESEINSLNIDLKKLICNSVIIDEIYNTIADTTGGNLGRSYIQLKENIGLIEYHNLIDIVLRNAGFKKNNENETEVRLKVTTDRLVDPDPLNQPNKHTGGNVYKKYSRKYWHSKINYLELQNQYKLFDN